MEGVPAVNTMLSNTKISVAAYNIDRSGTDDCCSENSTCSRRVSS